jgi:hypothetical protein
MDHPQSIAFTKFRQEIPGWLSLPWGSPTDEWSQQVRHLVVLPQGVARHPVLFLNFHGTLFAIKEMPAGAAGKEYALLEQIEALHLPVVIPAGVVQLAPESQEASYLITHYLQRSLPYRNLFMSPTQEATREHLLDSIASLLVQLHLAGIFWGDCSLSNTLFRYDAGALQAYLVDAESAEVQSSPLTPSLRFHELKIMEENIVAEMLELAQVGIALESNTIYETGDSIRMRYYRLWEEVTREEVIHPTETYRIQERIRSLNALGYSLRDVEFTPTETGDKLRLKILVADRSFHRNQLVTLTGLETEEMQARTLINEIQELRATQSRQQGTAVPIEAAAFYWKEHIFQPVVQRLDILVRQRHQTLLTGKSTVTNDPIELYCQVLEHKWYLSEKANHDVGHMAAVDHYIESFSPQIHNLNS